ncbi:MAG: NifU N-terminal domain-containing protein [Ardenticatenaceae bacterium]|nr:NifU N-terminal domain-containing protein [Ardenticatenaceae bacterium]MCB8947002.1 NifU N-terminal domain-containing protein [Ardenticatenaceae bacterium]
MSEYIEIETEISDDDSTLAVYTNLRLNDGNVETYHSSEELEEGSPVAQALAVIEGITYLQIEGSDLSVQRDPDTPWHVIISDISAALKDFFL